MRFVLLISAMLALAACSQQPIRAPAQPKQPATPVTLTPQERLKMEAEAARRRGDLIGLTHILSRLWSISDKDDQLWIEYLLYSQWHQADADQLDAAWQTGDDQIAPWALLAYLKKLHDPAALNKVLTLYPTAPFGRHLAYYLHRKPQPPRKIAVFLPLSGRFSAIGDQVRFGLLQTLFQADTRTTLLFFDSATDADTLTARYREALTAGADAIIGPLRPEAIERLSQISHLPTLFLNTPTNQFGSSFPYPTRSEAAQIHARLFSVGLHHLGVLYRETPRSAKLAAELQALWQDNAASEGAPYRMDSRPISNQHREIRRQFDQLIHTAQSKGRAHYLQQTLGHKLVFQPRPRQDLEALLLIMGPAEAAIINPLLDFYGLNLTVYGTSLLMPNRLPFPIRNRDLADITFPAFPALRQGARETLLQAWGSDALQLLLTPPPGNSCLRGLTGWLHRAPDNLWDRRLTWLKYDASGQLIQADTP